MLRVLRAKLRWATRGDARTYERDLIAHPEHRALAREVAEKSMVLLRNDGDLLPFDRAAVRRLAVIGRLADADNTGDRGSSRVRPPEIVTPLGGSAPISGRRSRWWRATAATSTRLAEISDAVVAWAILTFSSATLCRTEHPPHPGDRRLPPL